MRWLAGALLASGCLNPASTTCTSGDLTWVCPSGYACAEVGAYCGLAVQVEACAGASDFDSCTFTDQSTDTAGTCELGVCTACSAATQADLEGCTYAGWDAMDAPASPYLGVWDIARADAYVVGTGTLLHYDGKAWSKPDGLPAGIVATSNLGGVWASSSSDVWVAASGIANADLVHFDGTSWTLVPGGSSSESLDGIFGTGDHDIYAVGSRVATGFVGVVRHFDGTTWTSTDVGNKQLTGVWASATRAVAVGSGTGVGVVFRADNGGSFTDDTPAMPSPMPPLNAVWGSADTDIYAVGNISSATFPTMLHFDGSGWTPVPQCADASATQCFDPAIPSVALDGIWGLAANDIYAVGDEGVVAHFDGQRWTAEPITGPTAFRAVGGLANETIVVGDQKILREAP